MNIGSLEKTNLMIKELTKHGCVNNYNDAVSTAQGLYGGLPSSGVVTSSGAFLKDKPAVNISSSEPEVKKEIHSPIANYEDKPSIDVKSEVNKLVMEMFRDKLGAVLSAYNDGVMSEVDVLRGKMNAMAIELRTMKTQAVIQNVQASMPASTQVNPVQQTVQAAQEAPVQQAATQSNQRQGNYTSDDVCVEKMFYCGNN